MSDRSRAWIRRYAASLVGATIVGVTMEWPRLDVADQTWYIAAGTLLGLALGVFWQAVARRDLADRLVLLSVVVIGTGLLPVVVGQGNYRPATVHAGMSIVAGLVLTEHWLRWRTGRTVTANPPPAPPPRP
jgi:hypothetical protein